MQTIAACISPFKLIPTWAKSNTYHSLTVSFPYFFDCAHLNLRLKSTRRGVTCNHRQHRYVPNAFTFPKCFQIRPSYYVPLCPIRLVTITAHCIIHTKPIRAVRGTLGYLFFSCTHCLSRKRINYGRNLPLHRYLLPLHSLQLLPNDKEIRVESSERRSGYWICPILEQIWT